MSSAMPRRKEMIAVAALAIAMLVGNFCCPTAFGQVTLSPLTTFGSNGWLAPGAIPQLTTDNSQRGLGVSPTTGNVILPSRSSGTTGNNVWVISGSTGAVSGSPLTPPGGGYTGGTFVINGAGVGSDGAVYVANLSSSAASPLRVYKWNSDSDFVTPASIAFSGTFTGGAPRYGDAFAVYGSGTAAKFAAAGSNSATANVNSYFAVGSLSGTSTQSATAYLQVVNSQTTTGANNGYRLGLSFINDSSLLGTQGGNKLNTTTFSPSVSNIQTTGTTNWTASNRPIAYLSHNGTPYVATIDTNSSTVSLFDLTNPALPLLTGTGNTTVGSLVPNGNGTGGIGWGPYLGNDQYTLYAMASNQGIQAFVVTVPEPSTYAMMGGAFALIGLVASRKRRSEG
jgi:hypothetical protein